LDIGDWRLNIWMLGIGYRIFEIVDWTFDILHLI